MTYTIRDLARLYSEGVNINNLLRSGSYAYSEEEVIRLSYELQAGSYIEEQSTNGLMYSKYATEIADILIGVDPEASTILHAGCGELTSAYTLISRLKPQQNFYAVDVSLSRLLAGRDYLRTNTSLPTQPNLVVSGLGSLPFSSNCFDVVYTSHAIEPNYNESDIIISELARVSCKYLVLFEPCYETATPQMKLHMDTCSYARNIVQSATSHGLDLLDQFFMVNPIEPLRNRTSAFVFSKSNSTLQSNAINLTRPGTSEPLSSIEPSTFLSKGNGEIYVSVLGIPLLRSSDAITIAREDFFVC